MDNPKGTSKGELQQGAAGQTSQVGTEGTPQETIPETLTREQIQKLISDERAKAGRELKAAKVEAETYKTAHTKLESELTETRERMSEIQKRIDEAEEEEAKGSPESLRAYQKEKAAREREARAIVKEKAADEKERSVADRLAKADAQDIEMSIISAAVEKHVDIEKLKEKCQKFNLTTEEQISDMAETLASQAEGKKLPPKGDSGKTIGATGLGSLPPAEMLKEIQKKLRT